MRCNITTDSVIKITKKVHEGVVDTFKYLSEIDVLVEDQTIAFWQGSIGKLVNRPQEVYKIDLMKRLVPNTPKVPNNEKACL